MSVSLIRKPGTVFVDAVPPTSVQQQLETQRQSRIWARVAEAIVTDASPEPNPEPETPDPPTAEELLASTLPELIKASRWGRYIIPGPASCVFDGTVFVYHDPCSNFWDLYELSKGIFRDLGIRLTKPKGVWEAHIPIRVLTDKVFVESGLAGVERTLLAGTGMDPSAILANIRKRQFQKTHDSLARNKRVRHKEAIGDAVGLIAIIAVSWLSYIVM